MSWTTNDMRIEMSTAKSAQKAAETIKAFVNDNASTLHLTLMHSVRL